MHRPRPAELLARLPDPSESTDSALVREFLADPRGPAFSGVVARHGPMVLAVCRRVLGNRADAEDAFQATFLVLARKAGSIGNPAALPGWLHAVAVRAATEVRRMRSRNRAQQLPCEPADTTPDSPEPDLAEILDAELANLPEHYRTAVVLCELEGLSRADAASRLGIPEGTLSSRLAKAKKLLEARLTKRGIAAGVATTALTQTTGAALPPALVNALIQQVAGNGSGLVSETAFAAATGVLKTMYLQKLKWATVVLTVILTGVGGGIAGVGVGSGSPSDPPVAGAKPAPVSDPPKPDPIALVQKLGSPDFRTREQAQKSLENLGSGALAAVKAGRSDPDPEIARRCENLYPKLVQAAAIPPGQNWTEADKTALLQLTDTSSNRQKIRTLGLRHILERCLPSGDDGPIGDRLPRHPRPTDFLPALITLFDDTDTVFAFHDEGPHDLDIGTSQRVAAAARRLEELVRRFQIRDLALLVALVASGQNPADYGFLEPGDNGIAGAKGSSVITKKGQAIALKQRERYHQRTEIYRLSFGKLPPNPRPLEFRQPRPPTAEEEKAITAIREAAFKKWAEWSRRNAK